MSGTSVEKADGEHAEVAVPHTEVAVSHTEVEVSHQHPVYNPDAPSEAWGWHGSFGDFAHKGSTAMLVLFTFVIFIMLIGNHVSHTEDWYLVVIGLLMLVWIGKRESDRRKKARRKV